MCRYSHGDRAADQDPDNDPRSTTTDFVERSATLAIMTVCALRGREDNRGHGRSKGHRQGMIADHARRLERVDEDRHHDQTAANAEQAREETRRDPA